MQFRIHYDTINDTIIEVNTRARAQKSGYPRSRLTANCAAGNSAGETVRYQYLLLFDHTGAATASFK